MGLACGSGMKPNCGRLGEMAVDESMEDVLMKRLRALEHEQMDLLQQVVDVMRHALTGNHAMFVESLAKVVGIAYVMAQELGIPPERLDREVVIALMTMPFDPESDGEKAAKEVARYLKDRG